MRKTKFAIFILPKSVSFNPYLFMKGRDLFIYLVFGRVAFNGKYDFLNLNK